MNRALKTLVLLISILVLPVSSFSQEALDQSKGANSEQSFTEPLFEYVHPSLPDDGLTDFERYVFAGITRLRNELESGNSLNTIAYSGLFAPIARSHWNENIYDSQPQHAQHFQSINFELGYNDLRSSVASDLTIIYGGMIITLSKKDEVCSGTMKFRCGYGYDTVGRFDFHPNGMLRSLQYTRVKYLGYALMSSLDLYKYGENLRGRFSRFVEALNDSILSGAESRDIFTRGIDTELYPSKRVLWDDSGKILEYADWVSSRSANALEYDFSIIEEDLHEINPFHKSRRKPNNLREPLSKAISFEPLEKFDLLPIVNIPTENLNAHDRRKAELIVQLTRDVSNSKTLKELNGKLREFPFVELFEADPETADVKHTYTLTMNFFGNTKKSPCEFRYESPIGRFSICISFSAPNSKPDDYVLVEVLNADGASGCSVNALMSGVATDMFFHSGKEPLIAPLVFRRITGASDEYWEEYQKGFAPLYKMYEDSFATLGLNDVKVNYINNVQEVTRVVKHVKWNDSGEYLGQISWNRPITYQPQTGWLFKEKTPRFFNPDVVGYQCRVKATNSFNVYYGEGKAIVFGANSEEPIVSASSDAVPIDVDAVNPNASIETLPGEPNRFFTTSAD